MERENLPNHLIAQLHQSIWEGIRGWEKNIIQYIIILITIIAIVGYAFFNIEEKAYLIFPATIVSQLALLWILLINREAAYQYRSLQAISARIEKEFPELSKFIPESYRKVTFKKPDIYNIHAWSFFILLFLLNLLWIFLVFYWKQEVWKFCFVLLADSLVIIRYIVFRCQRKKKFIKNFPESQERS